MPLPTKRTGVYDYNDDEDYVPTKNVRYSEREDIIPLKKKKHTLDSDEEDNELEDGPQAYEAHTDILHDDDIEGQEEGTVEFEGETRITPFNMKEEMEEGHFDSEGFYHFKKETSDIKDAWLDDIDWVKVERSKGLETKYGSDVESESGDDSHDQDEAKESLQIYKSMLQFLKEGENVAKALKRLGGGKTKLTSSQRWKLKKAGKLPTEGESEKMKDFLQLTELADRLIKMGNMDVYQETYEIISVKIQRATAPKKADTTVDMFADDDMASGAAGSQNGNDGQSEDKGGPDSVEEIMWEFRWKNNDSEEIHGPFTSEKMQDWEESGYFKTGVYVRKTSEQGGNWYLSRRIDFELYK